MHFNKYYDSIPNSDKIASLSSQDNVSKITNTNQSDIDIDVFTGSADSGVNISDTDNSLHASPPLSKSSKPQEQQPRPAGKIQTLSEPFSVRFQKHVESHRIADNNAHNNSLMVEKQDQSGGTGSINFDNKLKSEQTFKNSCNTNNYNSSYQNSRNAVNSENVINNSHSVATEEHEAAASTRDATSQSNFKFNGQPRAASPPNSSIRSSSDTSEDPPSHQHHHFNRSPSVSIRSIDSSIIDSDSDLDSTGDSEGVHKNYVIKKLGTHVTYPPQHPDIPKINQGLEVVNHRVTPNGLTANSSAAPLSPLEILSNIGNSLGHVHSVGQMPCVSPNPQIAVSDSTDVTIGDKHFYEGPVTIQQFLIDSRDKRKEINGKDNPIFQRDNGDYNAKDINSSPAEPKNPYAKFVKRKRYIIPGVLSVIALAVLAIVYGIKALNDNKSKNVLGDSEESRKNIPINSTIDSNSDGADTEITDNCVDGELCFIPRDIWRAHPQTGVLEAQKLPLHRVVIAHTASEPCSSTETCNLRVRVIQEFHMNSFKWDDIGYNFLVSSDGRVYIGRGWNDVGAVVKGYNRDSVGIAFIGTYNAVKPTEKQQKACRQLIDEGVRLKKLDPNYVLNGARQLVSTESPGDALYKIIRTWPNWKANV